MVKPVLSRPMQIIKFHQPRLGCIEVTDDRVVRAGFSVTWSVLS